MNTNSTEKELTGYASIDRPWIKSYPNVRYDLYDSEFSKKTAFELIYPKMRANPEKLAYDFYGRLINNKTVLQNINIAAKCYKNLGIKRDDMVFVLGINTPEMIYTMYALNIIGAVTEWFNPLASSPELLKKYIIQSNVKYIFAIDLVYDIVMGAIKDTVVECVIVNSVLDSFPVNMKLLYKAQVFGLDYIMNTNILKKHLSRVELIPDSIDISKSQLNFLDKAALQIFKYAQKEKINIKASFYNNEKCDQRFIPWNKFITQYYSRDKITLRKYEEDRVTFIVHTGGTTGPVKRVAHTDYAINSAVYQAPLLNIKLFDGMSSLHLIPPIVALGLENIHLERFYNMYTHLICTYDRNEFIPLIKKHRPNMIVCVPSFASQITDENPQLKAKDNLSFIAEVLQGGEAFPINTDKAVDETLKKHGSSATSRLSFGQNEEFGAFTCPMHKNAAEKKYGSCGAPFPGNEFVIYDIENNCELPYGKNANGNYNIGELFVNGATMMKGYYGIDSSENEKNFIMINGKRFFDTGDQGYIDEQGDLYWVTRDCRIIRTQSGKIFTSVLENILQGFKEISECCVVSVPSPTIVKEASCHIVFKSNYADMKYEELYKVAQNIVDRLEKHTKEMYSYYNPATYEFRTSSFPYTSFGKIDFLALENENVNKYVENNNKPLPKIRIRK